MNNGDINKTFSQKQMQGMWEGGVKDEKSNPNSGVT